MTANLPAPDINVFLKRFAYLCSTDQVVDLDARPTDATIQMKSFKNLTASCINVIKGPRGGEKAVKVSEQWLTDPKRLTLSSAEYAPGKGRVYADKDGVPRHNIFTWPTHADAPIDEPDVGVFLEHMEYLIPDPAERKLFIQWLAHIIQHPEDRPTVVPLFVALEHGTGRGWITELMVKVLGLWNCGNTKMGQLAGEGSAGQYQNVLAGTILATIHETKVKDKSWTIDDQVRDQLTEQHLQLNTKYGSFDIQRVYARFLLYSNHVDAVRIPPEDRRIWVLKVDADPRDESYYIRIYGWLKGDGPANVYWYLKAVDLSDFNAGMRAPMSPAKRAMITEAQTSCETDIHDSLQLLPDGVDVATWDQVTRLVGAARAQSLLEDTGHHHTPKYDAALRRALADVGHTLSTGTKDNKVKWHSKGYRVYALRNRGAWRGVADLVTVRKQLDTLEASLTAGNKNLANIM